MERTNREYQVYLRIIIASLIGVMAIGLAGFDDEYIARRQGISPDASDANDSNKAIHTINPWPAYSLDTNLETSGRRMEGAIERYQTGKVKKPQGLRSSNNGNGIGNNNRNSSPPGSQ